MSSESLVLADPAELRQQLSIDQPIQATAEGDPALDKEADALVARLVAIDPSKTEEAEAGKAAVENMGLGLQEAASHRSDMLKEPIRKMGTRAEDGGEVANSLVDLKMQVEELDPGHFDLEPAYPFARHDSGCRHPDQALFHQV